MYNRHMKTCGKCKEEKPVTEFRKRTKSPDGLQHWCKGCQKEAYQNYYAVDPERYAQNKRRVEQRIKDIIIEKKSVPCMDCNQRYPSYVMDFDHRDPSKKSYTIGKMVKLGSVSALMKEIEKCDVVCANCHRERTYGSLA